MTLLCLDTATDRPVVAIATTDGTLLAGGIVDGRAQGVVALIDELVDAIGRDQIEAVIVGAGPGGFTGLRVGVATARGIAEALGVPLFAVSSLRAAAAGVPEVGTVRAVIAAGRGERYAQTFLRTQDGALIEPGPVETEDASAAVPATPMTPEALATVSAERWRRAGEAGEVGDPLGVLPSYGREPDAVPPRMDVVLDVLDNRDLDALLQLEERCFETPWTRGMYEQELERPAGHAVRLAARDAGGNDRLVGAALAARIGGAWHVMNVLVDPSARGRGIASRLVEELLSRTRVLGAGEGWTLEVRDGNDAAIALYEHRGFEHAGRRPGYYADTGEDALVMWRHATSDDAVVVQ